MGRSAAAAPVLWPPAGPAGRRRRGEDRVHGRPADAGAKKINVIKEVRAITGLGLKEAKDLVEGAPKELKDGIHEGRSRRRSRSSSTAAGATVEIK